MSDAKHPHIPAVTWLVEWQYPGREKHSRCCLTVGRSDEVVYQLMNLNPRPRVWQCGAIVCNGDGFA